MNNRIDTTEVVLAAAFAADPEGFGNFVNWCFAHPNSETFEWVDEDGEITLYDVTTAGRLAIGRQVVIFDLAPLVNVLWAGRIDIDIRKIDAIPEEAFRRPALIMQHRGLDLLIDGWHRIFKLWTLGRKEWIGVFFDEDDSKDLVVFRGNQDVFKPDDPTKVST